jgi:hypothetical protein
MNMKLFDLAARDDLPHSAYLGALLASIDVLIELYRDGDLSIDELVEKLETYTANIAREVFND